PDYSVSKPLQSDPPISITPGYRASKPTVTPSDSNSTRAVNGRECSYNGGGSPGAPGDRISCAHSAAAEQKSSTLAKTSWPVELVVACAMSAKPLDTTLNDTGRP